MAITVTCPCGKTYRVLDNLAGKRYVCPQCHTTMIVPDGSGNQPVPVVTTPRVASPKPKAGAPPAPQQRITPQGSGMGGGTPQPPTISHATNQPAPLPVQPVGSWRAIGSRQIAAIAAAAIGVGVVVVGIAITTKWLTKSSPMDAVNRGSSETVVNDGSVESRKPATGQSEKGAGTPLSDAVLTKGEFTVKAEEKKIQTAERATQSPEVIARKSAASVAVINGKLRSGTGFLVQPGILATNAHILRFELARDLKIHFPSATGEDKGPTTGEVIYEDGKRDLLFLSVASKLPALSLSEAFVFRKGMDVTIIGANSAGPSVLENAVSHGLLSDEQKIRGLDYYQLGTHVALRQGGAPVFDSHGDVIAALTRSAASQESIGFSIPVADLRSATTRATGQPREIRDEAANRHRTQVIVRLLAHASDIVMTGLDIHARATEVATKQGQSRDTAVDALSKVPDTATKNFDRVYGADLKSEMSEVTSNSSTPPQIRLLLVDLWTLCAEMKSYVDNPRGSIGSFRAKVIELKDARTKQIEKLQLLLGISGEDDGLPKTAHNELRPGMIPRRIVRLEGGDSDLIR
jgi:hypothetical protein